MIREYGSGENWQREKTFEWVQKLVCDFPDQKLIIFEGQVNLQFIKTGFERQNFTKYRIVMIDCTQGIMIQRLVQDRQQPWLASQDMKNWLDFLRNQAEQFHEPIINTSQISPNEVVVQFEQILSNHMILRPE